MKAYHCVTTSQALTVVIASALLSGAAVFAVNAYIVQQDLPIVEEADGKCVRVLNFKNGDGFQCQDLETTILRKYRRRAITGT